MKRKEKARNRIPKDDVVEFVIREVLRGKNVRTQAELAELSCDVLKGRHIRGITGRRARMVALRIPGVKMRVDTRNGPMPERCPCCSSELEKIYAKDLSGNRIIVGMECTKCSYRGHGKKWVPRRYGFEIAEGETKKNILSSEKSHGSADYPNNGPDEKARAHKKRNN